MYVEAALKGKNDFWRYFVSVVLFIIAYFLGQIPLSLVVLFKLGYGTETIEFLKTLDFESIGMDPLVGFALLICMFVFLFFSIIFSVTVIHIRRLKTLLTGYDKFNWNKVFFAVVVMFGLLVLNEIIFYFINPSNYTLNATFAQVLPLAIVALVLLPFQISAEEFLLRGYLVQGLGLIFRYGWIAVLITSVAFGLMHIQNPEVDEYGMLIAMSYYIGFGLFMGILVLLSGGLELSLGIHFIVNFYSIVFVTYPSSAIKTPALFMMEEYKPAALIIGFFLTAVIFLVIASVRYKWYSPKKIFEKVRIDEYVHE